MGAKSDGLDFWESKIKMRKETHEFPQEKRRLKLNKRGNRECLDDSPPGGVAGRNSLIRIQVPGVAKMCASLSDIADPRHLSACKIAPNRTDHSPD
jgi:hypothetical protein